MTDHRPLIGLQGTATRYFEEFLNSDNVFWDFSKDHRTHFLDGHVWHPVYDALPVFEKLFRDYTWLALLHGTMSIPDYAVYYMRTYQDSQIDFGGLYCDLIDRLRRTGLVSVVQLDSYLSREKKAAIFRDATDALYEVVSRNFDYFFPETRDLRSAFRFFEIANIGDYILSERISVAVSRPALYLEGYERMLACAGVYEKLHDLSCLVSEFLLPSIPIIEESVDLACFNGSVQDRINERVATLDDIRSSPTGRSFQTIASQVLNGASQNKDIERETIECLRKVLKGQRGIRWVKKITFYTVAASGAIGIFDPITGGISLVVSLTAPLILSYAQEKAWREVEKTFPGINYMYQVSRDMRSEFAMSAIAKMEERLSG